MHLVSSATMLLVDRQASAQAVQTWAQSKQASMQPRSVHRSMLRRDRHG